MLSYEPQGPIPNFSGLRDVPERDRCASPLSRRMFSTQVHGLQRTKVARDVDLGRVGLSHAPHCAGIFLQPRRVFRRLELQV